jgi:hypothetical protein
VQVILQDLREMSDSKLPEQPGPGRTQPAGREPPVAWQARKTPPNRHGAIARQLFNYSNYKSWVDRMRVSLAKDDAEAEALEASRPLR